MRFLRIRTQYVLNIRDEYLALFIFTCVYVELKKENVLQWGFDFFFFLSLDPWQEQRRKYLDEYVLDCINLNT